MIKGCRQIYFPKKPLIITIEMQIETTMSYHLTHTCQGKVYQKFKRKQELARM